MAVEDNYLTDLQVKDWVTSNKKQWWTLMVAQVWGRFKKILMTTDLTASIRAIKYGIPFNAQNLFSMLEHSNSDSYTFFMPVGEMGNHSRRCKRSPDCHTVIFHMSITSLALMSFTCCSWITYKYARLIGRLFAASIFVGMCTSVEAEASCI